MNRVLQFGFILVCLTGISLGGHAACSYFGEPHLIPFPTECEPIQYQYICQPKVPEVLVSNPYLVINVESTPIGNYPILKYNLTIFGVPGYPSSCFIGDSITAPKPFPPTCPSDSPVIVVVSGTNYYLIHKTQPEIIIHVNKIKRYFEIDVDLPFDVIEQSQGVCVEWECEFETELIPGTGKRSTEWSDLAEAYCHAYADLATKISATYGPVNSGYVNGRIAACVYDLRMTGNFTYALGVLTGITQNTIGYTASGPKGESTYKQAMKQVQEAICGRQQADAAIASSYPPLQGILPGSGYIQPDPIGSECQGGSYNGGRDEN